MMITVEVRNDELVASITRQAAERSIANAAIVSLVGAVDTFTLSTMAADDATKDISTDYELPAELSGTGEITNGVVHIHAVMAVEGDQARSGHLHRADVGTWFARAYIVPASPTDSTT